MTLRAILFLVLLGFATGPGPAAAQGKASCQTLCSRTCDGSRAKGNCMDKCLSSCAQRQRQK